MSRDWIVLLIFFGICFAVGASGSLFTASSVKTWYPSLLKPATAAKGQCGGGMAKRFMTAQPYG